MEQGRSQPILNGEPRSEMLKHVNTILKMAEHFREVGERELEQECRNTANRMLDLIFFNHHGIPKWSV